MWKNGEAKLLSSFVGSQLPEDEGKKAKTLSACGVNKLTAYAELTRMRKSSRSIMSGSQGKRMLPDPTIRVEAGYT